MKKNKRAVFLSILLICLVSIFVGCTGPQPNEVSFVSYHNNNYSKTETGSSIDGKIYIPDFTTSIWAGFKVGSNYQEYKSWKIFLDSTQVNGNKNATISEDFEVRIPYKLNNGTQVLFKDKTYKVKLVLYEQVNYGGQYREVIAPTIVTSEEPKRNDDYIGYDTINNILKANGEKWINTINGSPKDCATNYNLANTKENQIVCLALSQIGDTGISCADFAKKIVRLATGVKTSTIYGYGTKIDSTYNVNTYNEPSVNVSLLNQFNSEGTGVHISLVYKDKSGNWWSIGGGMHRNKKVTRESLKDITTSSWVSNCSTYAYYKIK